MKQPDTWTAIDGLGRHLSTSARVGPPRAGRQVGMFYFLWLGQHGQTGPWNVDEILKEHPGAMDQPTSPPWGPLRAYHHWSEPLFGYYLSDDEWVYRKHAQMLSDAGVDVVIFDCTNQFSYPESYEVLCRTWRQVREEGNPTPQIAFLCPFGDPSKVVADVYENLYGPGRYQELWYLWKGRPLIMADPALVEGPARDFFTFRKPQSTYFQGPSGADQWGWLEVFPQHVYHNSEGEAEQMTVGVGQNAVDGRLGSMSEEGAAGRSWHNVGRDERPGAVKQGFNVMEQWERALDVDPQFVFITGWNEWVAMRLNEFFGVSLPVMFVDQFDVEHSRDIEPENGILADHYYYQLVDYVRRYKGAAPAPPAGERATITIGGSFDDWKAVQPEYRDDVGDTAHRDHPAWGGKERYVNRTGRNDIVLAKVARDSDNVYFYVQTREALTAPEGGDWMTLHVNRDRSHRTGTAGFDITVRNINGDCRAFTDGGEAAVQSHWAGNDLELVLPRKMLVPDGERLQFDFKWTDNCNAGDNPLLWTVNGDAAPNGRFTYRYQEALPER